MGSLRKRRGRTDGTERGASLVEFALLLPLLVILLIGTFTTGITLSYQNSLKNAVREGSRLGAVLPVDPAAPLPYLQTVLKQTVDAATGDLDPGVPERWVCVAYVATDNATVTRLTTAAASVQSEPCIPFGASGDTRTEARVQVVAQRRSTIDGVFFRHSPLLTSRSVTRYER
jgi:Flp pilus assembly protein TadG